MNEWLKKIHILIESCFRMSFFSRGSNGRGANRGRGNNWQRGHRRPRFSIHFDVDPQELNQLFQDGFFNLVGQGIMQPRPKRPPFQPHQNFSGVCVPPHVSMQPEQPVNDVGKKLSISPLYIIMVYSCWVCVIFFACVCVGRFPRGVPRLRD
jgi:hypothetical protein